MNSGNFIKPNIGGANRNRGGFSGSHRASRGAGNYGGRPFGRNSFRGGGKNYGRSGGEHIDISRFINKAVVTEEAGRYVPEHTFADFPIDVRLKQNIIAKGYKEPTPIQDRTIPYILKGQDIVGIANTGT
ncbi:DEAD/DEAH box helicase, partial [Patescibacteria group bacterium]|nr:DEAD/DEAH box helicase [Patescibacteria group bacterium]